jgi:beta-lactamase class A
MGSPVAQLRFVAVASGTLALLSLCFCSSLGARQDPPCRYQLEDWLVHNETGTLMIRAAIPKPWTVRDKTGRCANGATNDVAFVRPTGPAPILLAIYSIGSTPEQL